MTAPSSLRPARVGVLGAGIVGTAFIQFLQQRDDLEVSRVLVRDPRKARAIAEPGRLLTTDPAEVLEGSDIVVELMGGTGLAADLISQAAAAGKAVVSANKAVLAERWDELLPHLRAGRIYYEAAVMAGTPAVGPLSGALRGSRPLELHAILNGTCTYILSQLEGGESYRDALAEAQRLGYAEADPSLDVDGVDAAHKLTILGRLAFDPELSWDEVRANTHGISHLTPAIVKEAMEDGGSIRLVGSVIPQDGRWRARVRPVYLPAGHPLAGTENNRNALLFRGDGVGEVLISGVGAGGASTASAVLADVLAAAAGRPGPLLIERAAALPTAHRPEDLGELLRA